MDMDSSGMNFTNMDFWMMLLKAFAVGGLICVVGQVLIDRTKMTATKILVTFVVLGVVLGSLGWYEWLSDWAGSGANVPLTGFGNLLAKGVRDAMETDGWQGIVTGGLTAAAGGITVAVFSGFIASLVTKSSAK